MYQEKSKNCDVDKLSEISGENNNISFSYDNMSMIESLLDSEETNLSIKDDDNIKNKENLKNQIYFNAYLYLQQFNRNNQILSLINEINRFKLLQMIMNNQTKK